MSSIGAVGRAVPAAYQPTRVAARAPDSTPTPAASPIDRVDKLTRQLDASLTYRLDGIRARISTNGSAYTQAPAASRRLDIGA